MADKPDLIDQPIPPTGADDVGVVEMPSASTAPITLPPGYPMSRSGYTKLVRAARCAADLPDYNHHGAKPRYSKEARWRMIQERNTPERKATAVAAAKKMWSRPGHKELVANAIKKSLARPGMGAKLSRIRKATMSRPEVRAKISASNIETSKRPDVVARRKAALAKANARPEVKANRSAAAKKWQSTPEAKAAAAARNRAAWQKPGERERRIAIFKVVNATPEMRRRQSKSRKEVWRRPGFREEMSAKARARGPDWQMDDRNGVVYWIVNARTGYGKLGSARDEKERLRHLIRDGYPEAGNIKHQFAKPGDPLEVVLAVPCDYFRRVEIRAHELLGMDEHYKAMHGEQTPPGATQDDVEAAIEQAIREIDGEQRAA